MLRLSHSRQLPARFINLDLKFYGISEGSTLMSPFISINLLYNTREVIVGSTSTHVELRPSVLAGPPYLYAKVARKEGSSCYIPPRCVMGISCCVEIDGPADHRNRRGLPLQSTGWQRGSGKDDGKLQVAQRLHPPSRTGSLSRLLSTWGHKLDCS